MKKNTLVVEKLMEMEEESQNYIYIHTNTEDEEVTFVAKGNSEVLVDSLVQIFEDDKNMLNIIKQAVLLFELHGKTSTMMN